MANIIKGNHDGKGGRNETYSIPSRGKIKRTQLVKEVESGNHPSFTIYKINRTKFVRAKPDFTEKNNVNS